MGDNERGDSLDTFPDSSCTHVNEHSGREDKREGLAALRRTLSVGAGEGQNASQNTQILSEHPVFRITCCKDNFHKKSQKDSDATLSTGSTRV